MKILTEIHIDLLPISKFCIKIVHIWNPYKWLNSKMSLSISNEKSINKRYVQGLKIASITLFGLYLMGLSTVVILPGLEAPFTRQILTFLFLGGLLI